MKKVQQYIWMFPVIRVPPKHPKLVYFSIGTILEPMVFWVTPILGIIHDISLGGYLRYLQTSKNHFGKFPVFRTSSLDFPGHRFHSCPWQGWELPFPWGNHRLGPQVMNRSDIKPNFWLQVFHLWKALKGFKRYIQCWFEGQSTQETSATTRTGRTGCVQCVWIDGRMDGFGAVMLWNIAMECTVVRFKTSGDVVSCKAVEM